MERAALSWKRLGTPGRVVTAALLVGSLLVLVVWLPLTMRILGIATTMLALSWAALIDLTERRLPNTLVIAGATSAVVTGLIVTVLEGFGVGGDVALSALTGAAILAVPLLLIHLLSPRGMGFGDVKGGAALGLAIGLVDAWTAVVALLLACSVTAAVGLATHRRTVPFGPGLVGGAVAALLVVRVFGVDAVV